MEKSRVGKNKEALASSYLKKNGCVILESNYRSKFGEIDLIVKEQNTISFVEVKYRSTKEAGFAQEAVTYSKMRKICKTADCYIMKKALRENQYFRFDVVAINGEKIEWIKNAFEYIGQ